MKKMIVLIMILSLIAILFLLSDNPVMARAFNNDFETGDLTDWEKTGTAFDFQPTWGDNPTARNRGSLLNIKEIGGLGFLKSIRDQKKANNSDRMLGVFREMHLKALLPQLSSR